MVNTKPEVSSAEGLKEMRNYYQEFKTNGERGKDVCMFLEKSFEDEVLLLRYLTGRKYRAKHAWETLKSYAEVRFDKYRDMFPETVPEKDYLLIDDKPIFGVLKKRDSTGRRIVFFNASGWNTDKHSLKDMTIATLPTFERLLLDEDCMNNGMVGVQECSGMGMSHAKQYTLDAVLRLINLYWYSFPIKVKQVYFLNVPYFLTFLYGIIKPFLPKKLKERFVITSRSRKFESLHDNVDSDILPTFLGGQLDIAEAIDKDFLGFEF